MKKSEHRRTDLWASIKQANICIRGSQKDKREENGAERTFEQVMNGNASKFMKDKSISPKIPTKATRRKPIEHKETVESWDKEESWK